MIVSIHFNKSFIVPAVHTYSKSLVFRKAYDHLSQLLPEKQRAKEAFHYQDMLMGCDVNLTSAGIHNSLLPLKFAPALVSHSQKKKPKKDLRYLATNEHAEKLHAGKMIDHPMFSL